MGDVYMVNGKILSGLPNHAKDIEFDKTGTTLSSTNTEDAIKEVNSNLSQNNIGSDVDILGYNDSNNRYTIPTDGYIFIQLASGTGNITATIRGADGLHFIQTTVTQTYEADSVFVKKGMKVQIAHTISAGGVARAQFKPLE